MKKLWISIMSLLLILVSCAPKEQAPQEKAVEVITDDLTDPILPDCDMGMNRPEIISPKQEIIDASPPHTFSWNIGCVPDQYHILVYPNEDNIVPVISEYFSPDGKEYTSNVQFDPVTTYIWTISAFIEPHPAPKVSLQGSFSTGPVCSGQDLVPPTLVSPADGSIDGGKGWGYLEEVQTTIKYPAWHLEPLQQFGDGCTPEYFEIDLSVNPDFSGPDPWNLGGQSHFGTLKTVGAFLEMKQVYCLTAHFITGAQGLKREVISAIGARYSASILIFTIAAFSSLNSEVSKTPTAGLAPGWEKTIQGSSVKGKRQFYWD